MAQHNRKMNVQTDYENGVLTYAFTDEEGNPIPGVTVTFDINDVAPYGDLGQVAQNALLKGIHNRLYQAVGSNRGHDAADAMEKVAADLRDGVWKRESRGGNSGPSVAEQDFATALSVLYNCSYERAEQTVQDLSDERAKQLKSHPRVKAEIERARAARFEQKATGDLPSLDEDGDEAEAA